jgi:hypothetical protein
MIRPHGCRKLPSRQLVFSALGASIALAFVDDAAALDTKVSGRMMFGAAFRTEAPDPHLMVSYNAAAVGLTGLANGGQNTDDANLNFSRGEATTRALRGYLDLALSEGSFSGLVRVKAWHDFALTDHARPWGNNANRYAAGEPLSDNGAARLSRFSGLALGDVFIQHSTTIGAVKTLARLGQQTLSWGERAAFPGGLSALNANDQPSTRRAGVSPQELRVPTPMLFARADLTPAVGVEGFYSSTFRPSALDMCGTFWATTDYLAEGCDRAFAGAMPVSDRTRLANGAFLKRSPSPTNNDGPQFGAALTWKSAALATDFGFYAARYINRTPMPGLRKSTRVGPAFIAGDPDGRNIVYFTEHPDDIKLYAINFATRRGATTWTGEFTYRPNQPLQLPPGDVLPAFLSPTAPTLLRGDANAIAPGGDFSGYDRHKTMQLQVGLVHDWGKVGSVVVSGGGDIIGKHVISLPDQSVRRYGRPDQFGSGPVNGVCTVNTVDAGRQCSEDGYVTPTAWEYRLRVDARMAEVMPGLNAQATAIFTHDVKGWAHDFLTSEGRKTLNLALRFEYRQRYVAEIMYLPIWGGVYNNQVDKDQVALAVGVKF